MIGTRLMYRVGGHGNGRQQLRRQRRRDVDARWTVDRADHGDRRSLIERKAEPRRQDERGEYAELTCGPHQRENRLRQQRPEVHQHADANEDEERKQLRLDADLVEDVEHAAGVVERRVRQVPEQRAEADRQQQVRFVLLRDGQIDEQPGHAEHHEHARSDRLDDRVHQSPDAVTNHRDTEAQRIQGLCALCLCGSFR